MKIKRTIYFVMLVLGVVVMLIGEQFEVKEYAYIVGIIFLMWGIYGSTRVWIPEAEDEDEKK